MFCNLSHSSWCAAVFCHTVNCRTTQHQQNETPQSSHVSKAISTYQMPQMHMHLSSTQCDHTYTQKTTMQVAKNRQHQKSDGLPKSQVQVHFFYKAAQSGAAIVPLHVSPRTHPCNCRGLSYAGAIRQGACGCILPSRSPGSSAASAAASGGYYRHPCLPQRPAHDQSQCQW